MERHGQENVSLEEVKHAIDVLYKGSDTSKKDQASRWLEDFQHSVSICHVISHGLVCFKVHKGVEMPQPPLGKIFSFRFPNGPFRMNGNQDWNFLKLQTIEFSMLKS